LNNLEEKFLSSCNKSHCLIVGEIAQAHDGSLGMAHAYIDAIADAGADAVKFQTHIASAESLPSEPWRIKFSKQDDTRMDYWKRMEFTESQWQGLKEHANERELIFLSSPFSLEALEMLRRIGVNIWKVASGEVASLHLLDKILSFRQPVIISTGMSPISETDELVEKILSQDIPFAVLQCTSMYPTPPEKLGLNMIPFYRERYHCAVGLSDHSGTIFSGLAAAVLGINVLEVHVTFNRKMFGPDVVASVTTDELAQLVQGVRFIEKANATPIDKQDLSESLVPIRNLFTKSIVARSSYSAGTIITKEMLTFKKPGNGIPEARLEEIVGRRLKNNIEKDHLISEADLE